MAPATGFLLREAAEVSFGRRERLERTAHLTQKPTETQQAGKR